MRLRELTYPIAIVRPNGLMGGRSAQLSGPSRFAWNFAPYYLEGGFDHAVFYDSEGRVFEVKRIELTKPQWWRYVLDRLDYLIIFPNPDIEDVVNVDMVLSQTGTITLEDFCKRMVDLLLSHPSWWKRFSTEARVRRIFEGDTTFKDAIDHIGVYDPPGKEKLPGRSSKAVDLRVRSVKP